MAFGKTDNFLILLWPSIVFCFVDQIFNLLDSWSGAEQHPFKWHKRPAARTLDTSALKHNVLLLFSPRLTVGPQQRVDAVHDPAEEPGVQSLPHGVPHLHRLLHRVGPDDGLTPRHHAVGGQGFLELVPPNAQQGRHCRETQDNRLMKSKLE